MAKGRPVGRASLPSVLRFSTRLPSERAIHANKKPAALYRAVLSYCCLPGDVVFDPFAGSGTAILAAQSLGCPVIAAELDPDVIEVAVRHTARPHAAIPRRGHTEHLPLFAGPGDAAFTEE